MGRPFVTCTECTWIGPPHEVRDIEVCPACGGSIYGVSNYPGNGFTPTGLEDEEKAQIGLDDL